MRLDARGGIEALVRPPRHRLGGRQPVRIDVVE
jgi:hypothetical protein